ncbi:hypothetical protein B0H14DRAFT_3481400 [Mycena olivaceomarginata]|nr:hypothetical protein B0H14DRAFT_3481400 [Mycena olivaceomarginata]
MSYKSPLVWGGRRAPQAHAIHFELALWSGATGSEPTLPLGDNRTPWKTRGVVCFTRPPLLPRLVSQPLAQAAERRAFGSSHTHELAL